MTAPGPSTLLLVPTAKELGHLRAAGGFPAELARVELVGLGPIAAAARTAELCARLRPRRVLLCGIAGIFDVGHHAPGEALAFGRVACEGVGVGAGADFRGTRAIGIPQWDGCASHPEPIHDELPLDRGGAADALLLTTCAASDAPALAAERRRRFPAAVAEDMEGFGVALACTLAGVPAAVVRGLSNVVGERDPRGWCIPEALGAARALALTMLEDGAGGAHR